MTDSADIDLESEWAEMSGGWFGSLSAAGGDPNRPALLLFPVMLLYVGFFFGPWGTVLAALLTMRGQLGPRRFGVVVGTCGTAWCLLQGLSIYNGAWWSELELQTMRSGINFLAGIVAYVVVRPVALAQYRQNRVTLVSSAFALMLSLVLFVLIPTTVLVLAGR